MFDLVRRGGVCFLQSTLLNALPVHHALTLRQGGISPEPFDTLNMGLHTEDKIENVIVNRSRVCDALGVSLDSWVAGVQVHGVNYGIVKTEDAGRGARSQDSAIPNTDILVTNTPGLLLASFYADCVPVLLTDPVRQVVAVAHCGWRGTLREAAGVAVKAMVDEFGSLPSDLMAVIGPSIGPCCYEVSESLARDFEAHFGADIVLGRQLDLRLANRRVLRQAGLRSGCIHMAPWCTRCQQQLFFSHRAAKGRTGRTAVLLGLR